MDEKTPKSKQEISEAIAAMRKELEERGIERIERTGGILMPLPREQREAMERSRTKDENNPDKGQ